MSRNARAVAQRLLDLSAETGDRAVTPMQLLKLVYIAHGYMLGKHGMPLLNEPVQAWQYGPVVRSVYDAVRGYRSMPVDAVPGAPVERFTPEEEEVMATVAKKYSTCDGIVLSAATHQPGTPWSVTWSMNGRNSTISNDLIENFYKRILNQPKHSAL